MSRHMGNRLVLDPVAAWPEMSDADLDARLDEAEAAAGLAMRRSLPPPGPRTGWAPVGFFDLVGLGETRRLRRHVQAPWRPRWLIVSTPGFEVTVTMGAYLVLDQVDGDLYLWSRWDKLAEERQLDRVALHGPTVGPGTDLLLTVTPRPTLVTFRDGKVPFRAMLLGEQLL